MPNLSFDDLQRNSENPEYLKGFERAKTAIDFIFEANIKTFEDLDKYYLISEPQYELIVPYLRSILDWLADKGYSLHFQKQTFQPFNQIRHLIQFVPILNFCKRCQKGRTKTGSACQKINCPQHSPQS